MSNCCTIYNAAVISTRKIDGPRLIADLTAYEATNPSQPDWGLKDPSTFYMWWFLGTSNVSLAMRGKVIVIDFGYHRSGHTQRDLQGSLNWLGRYLLVDEIKIPVVMSDEYDGHATSFNTTLDIKRPTDG